MGRRPSRIALFVVALLASGGIGYLALEEERRLTTARQEGVRLDQAAEEALRALLDIRGSMHAYVAPNQGTAFWGRRVDTLLDALRRSLVMLDAAGAALGASLGESLDGIDQLTAADTRVRQYADRGELQLAGDVLFTEVRDLLKGVTDEVVAIRRALGDDADRKLAGIRQEQGAMVLGGCAMWLFVALVLLPGRATAAKEPGEWRQDLANSLKKPFSPEELNLDLRKIDSWEPAPGTSPVAPTHPDLKVVEDLRALSGALARASDVIGATGLIVWVATNDGTSLSAVSSHGFDGRVVERFGSINRSSANLTAEAYRDNAPRVRAAKDSGAAAIAVPIGGPSGPVGVLSAELHPGREPDDACLAVAAMVAAQLGALAAPLLPVAPVKAESPESTA